MHKLNDKQKALWSEDFHRDNVEKVKQALMQLSVQERASLLLTVSGFTPEEITEILNVESGKSTDIIRRGQEKFLSAYRTTAFGEELDRSDEDAELLNTLIRLLPDIDLPLGPSPQLEQLWLEKKDDLEQDEVIPLEQDEVIPLEQDEDNSQHLPITDGLPDISLTLPSSIEEPYSNVGQEFTERENSSENALKLYGNLNNLVPKEDHRIGTVWGNYRLVRTLSKASYATVYLAEKTDFDICVAIKVLNVQLASSDVEQFCTEARKLTLLEHPSITKILDIGVEKNVPFLVMNYAPKGSLRNIHPRGTLLPTATVLSYIKQIASVLQYIHDRGIIHQDIKPENFLMGEDNKILLADFGIARMLPLRYEIRPPTIWSFWDTMPIPYIAPEQYEGRICSASDQYALGIMVYELLTGGYPCQDFSTWALSTELTSQAACCGRKMGDTRLSPAIKKVVSKALKEDPEHRYPTVSAFATALERAYRPNKTPSKTSALIHKPQPKQAVTSNRAKMMMPVGWADIKRFVSYALVLCAMVIGFSISLIEGSLVVVSLFTILTLSSDFIALHPIRFLVFISAIVSVIVGSLYIKIIERDKEVRL